MENIMAKRKALLVGINYPDTSYPLQGCVNDVNLMADILTEQYGFTAPNRRMLTDKAATAAAIRERLEWLVADAEAGDVLYFHYSGHGSQMVNQSYDTTDLEPDNKDEIIVPYDNNWRDKVIRDDELKKIFDKVPNGVALTVVLDCCNSGTGLDQANTYQPYGLGEARALQVPLLPNEEKAITNRLLPMPDDIANRERGLDLEVKPRSVQTRALNNTGLLIAASQSQQTSADAWISGAFYGAATFYLAESLKQSNYDITHKELIINMNDFMVEKGYSQRPELDGSEGLFDTKFMEPIFVKAGLDEPISFNPPVMEPTVKPDQVVKPKPKKNIKKYVIAAAVVAAVAFVVYSLM